MRIDEPTETSSPKAASQQVALQLEAARHGAAFAMAGGIVRVRITGRHRHRFIHNMTTCQIKELQPGQGNFGLIVNDAGKLVAHFNVEAEEASLDFELDADRAEAAVAQLKRYIIADDVHFSEPEARRCLALVGPLSAAALEAQFGEPMELEPHAWRDISSEGSTYRVRRNDLRLGLPGWDIHASQDDVSKLADRLRAGGAQAMGRDAWDALRIDSGWPRDGIDMTDANIPLESDRLAATIDWDKGCYIGQEVIAMMQYRGKPNKHLVRLEFEGVPEAEIGSALQNEAGKVVGRLGSRVHCPQRGAVALAVIKRRHATEGDTVRTAGGEEATIRRFPKFEMD